MTDLDSRARRLARNVGLVAHKSRLRRDSVDNHGGYMLVELNGNTVVAGARYDLSVEQVIKYCTDAHS
ncbi:MAG: hypothetical protein ACLQJR_21530 [Stellaceae bacterium]